MIQNVTPTTVDETTTDILDRASVDRAALARLDLDTISMDDLADWLASNGASYLSTIERIELAERLITRRRFLIGAGGLLGAAALGACGAGEQEAGAPTVVGDGTRLFDHPLLVGGPVRIPENPQRIVILSFFDVLSFIRADIDVVGASLIEDVLAPEFPEWEEELSNVPDIGFPPNVEALASLEPDLILTADFTAEEVGIGVLNTIAPTASLTFPAQSAWKDRASLFFDAVGRAEVYDALLAEYDERVTELRTLIKSPEEIEISLLNVRANNDFRIYTQYSGGGGIVEDIGFDRPKIQRLPVTHEEYVQNPDEFSEFSWSSMRPVSLETLQDADGDFIIVFGIFGSDDNAAQLETLLENPLWQQLTAAQNEQVFITDANLAGTDMASAHNVLDVIAEAFGVVDQFSPNPYEVKYPIPSE